MSFKFEAKGITCDRKYDNWVGGRSLNNTIIKVFEQNYTVMNKKERDTFIMRTRERTYKGHFEDFYENLRDYSYYEVLDMAIDSKIKRLQKNNELGIRLLNYYDIKLVITKSDDYDDVLYAFLINKSYLDFFKHIEYSRDYKKFIAKNENRTWSFDYKIIEELDFYELPCIIRLY